MKTFETDDYLYKIEATAPLGSVKPGEDFCVHTRNAFGGDFKSLQEFERFMQSPDKNQFNHPLTGPIHIEGVEQGSSLVIFIQNVIARNARVCLSTSTGIRKGEFEGREPVFLSDGNAEYTEFNGIWIKKRPSIGVLATIDDQRRSAGRCSENGGNMDFPQLRAGSRLYLPLNHPEALLAIGDVHMRQGYGEIPGMGYEADGEIQLSVQTTEKIPYPVIDSGKELLVMGWGGNPEEAQGTAVRNAMDYLKRLPIFSGWSEPHLYEFLAGFNLVPGNLTGKVPTFGILFPKQEILDPRTGKSVFEWPSLKNINPTQENNFRSQLSEGIAKFDTLPLFHSGDSREIRTVKDDSSLLIQKLQPTMYSFAEKGSVAAPAKTAELRAKMNQKLSEILHHNGVRTTTLETEKEFVLMRKVEAAKRVEVVVKSAFIGSPAHLYSSLSQTLTRTGETIAKGAPHAPYVRFDWRNPPPGEDITIPEGLVAHFIDTERASDTVLKAFEVLEKYLSERKLKLRDGCFFLSQDGSTLCGEISMDNLGLIYSGEDGTLQSTINTRKKTGEKVLERYQAIWELLK
ncbi:MAG: Acetamidase/Formamidase [uncultured bacterium]|nr:MAG: Acetamidase/Formamidase [uncultured bacterium]